MGGSVSPAPIQGDCSYTIYGRIHSKFVIQFRLPLQSLRLKTAALARKIHGNLVPTTTYDGQLGDISQETASVYSPGRILGISYIELRLADTHAENSEEDLALRVSLMVDLVR